MTNEEVTIQLVASIVTFPALNAQLSFPVLAALDGLVSSQIATVLVTLSAPASIDFRRLNVRQDSPRLIQYVPLLP